MEHLLHTQALTIVLPLVPPYLDVVLPLETPSFFSHLSPHCFH